MNFLTGIYFFYMFVSIYFLLITLILYFRNRGTLFSIPKLTKNYSLTVLIPSFNEGQTIKDTIEHIFASDYKGLKQVIVINDGSSDNTKEVVEKLLKKFKGLKLINKKNSGKADSLNYALNFVKTDLVAVIDADSYPNKNAFSRLCGFFDDKKVGVVTAACTPRNRKKLLERLQSIEYKVIAFTRKLLEYIDSIYVAPGSLSIYRTHALKGIGGFDIKNMTEDIESTWHMLRKNWKVKMCLAATVTTTVPNKISPWFKQRVRWSIGGLQVLNKYKSHILKENMLGYFVIPFFFFGLFLSLIGFLIMAYLLGKKFIGNYVLVKYGVIANTAILGDLNLVPGVINFFGITLFILFFAFTVFVLGVMKDNFLEKENIFHLLLYMTFYLLTYPLYSIVSVYKLIRGNYKWR